MKEFYSVRSIAAGEIVLSPETNCRHIEIVRGAKAQPSTTPPSTYTSQGKHKCTRQDPIRRAEDVQLMMDYFLNNGRKSLRMRNYMIFVVGVSLGLRGCDLLRLKIRDVLNPDGTIVKQISTFESKKDKMNYPILNERAQVAIADYLNSLTQIRMDDNLFKAEGRDDMDEDTLYQMMHNAAKKLKIPGNIGAHSLRKTFAYWNIKLHMNDMHVLASLQEMLNHDSMATTLHYAGHTRDHVAALYDDMASVFELNSEPTAVDDTLENKIDKVLEILGG